MTPSILKITINNIFLNKLLMKEYDEIIYMDEGKIIAHGPFNEIVKNEKFKTILKIKFGELIEHL